MTLISCVLSIFLSIIIIHAINEPMTKDMKTIYSSKFVFIHNICQCYPLNVKDSLNYRLTVGRP